MGRQGKLVFCNGSGQRARGKGLCGTGVARPERRRRGEDVRVNSPGKESSKGRGTGMIWSRWRSEKIRGCRVASHVTEKPSAPRPHAVRCSSHHIPRRREGCGEEAEKGKMTRGVCGNLGTLGWSRKVEGAVAAGRVVRRGGRQRAGLSKSAIREKK